MSEKIADTDYSTAETGIAYKVFLVKDGKLYPPMVKNPGGADTPTGVWLDAEEGEFVELDGRKRVIQRGTKKSTVQKNIDAWNTLSDEEKASESGKALRNKITSGTLAYRPGWHLGDEPIAKQFNRDTTFIEVEKPDFKVSNATDMMTFSKNVTKKHDGEIFYVRSEKKYYQVVHDGKPHLPLNFVWAECEYIMGIDYQEQAMAYGYTKSGKFQHSLAGLPELPKGGYYRYRTNPKIDTVPWVITGAIKINKLLDDYAVDRLTGGKAPIRQGGMKTLQQLGINQI